MNLLDANDAPGRHPPSWYAATAEAPPEAPPLRGEARADVCVVGGGFTGLSAALALAEAGSDVVLIEAQRFGFGASGRNGGQVGTGQRLDQVELEPLVGRDAARALWEIGLEAVAECRRLVEAHAPEAGWTPGVAHVDRLRGRLGHHRAVVGRMAEGYGYERLELLDAEAARALTGSARFVGGVLDHGAAHIHPLRLAFGLARAAAAAGARLHERTRAVRLSPGARPIVETVHGRVMCDHVVLAGNGYLGELDPEVAARVMPINNFVVATEPLGDRMPLTRPVAVADGDFVVNYWRPTQDGRIVFGGGESYGYRFPRDLEAVVRPRLERVYPALKGVGITHAWGGTLAITRSRLPHVARRGAVWSSSGYSGHGGRAGLPDGPRGRRSDPRRRAAVRHHGGRPHAPLPRRRPPPRAAAGPRHGLVRRARQAGPLGPASPDRRASRGARGRTGLTSRRNPRDPPMSDAPIDVTRAEPIPEAARAEIERLLTSGDLFRYTSDDAPVARLEAEFAAWIGARFAVAASSCSSAIFLGLRALDLAPGARVLVPAFTFAAVPSAVVHAGCVPVLVEVGEDYRLDLADLADKMPGAAAILVSHMRGHTSDMDAVLALASEAGIPVVEDAAHSLGTTWRGRAIGTLGAIGCFSFQSYKLVNAGEGGILVTDDADLAARAAIMSGAYEGNGSKHPGLAEATARWRGRLPLYNMRMQNLGAAVIRPQIPLIAGRAARGLANHDRVAARLRAEPWFDVPTPLAHEARAPDSVQFNLVGMSDPQCDAFLRACADRGAPVQLFGAEGNARAFWTWAFLGDPPDLPRTRAMLARACDLRLPARLTERECDALAEAIVASGRAATGARIAAE